MDLEWKEPPPAKGGSTTRRGTGKYSGLASTLRSKPGKWAYLGPMYQTAAEQIAARYALDCETRVRPGERKLDAYFRFVPDKTTGTPK